MRSHQWMDEPGPLQGRGPRRDLPITRTLPDVPDIDIDRPDPLHDNAEALRDSLEEVMQAYFDGEPLSPEVRTRAMQALRASKGL